MVMVSPLLVSCSMAFSAYSSSLGACPLGLLVYHAGPHLHPAPLLLPCSLPHRAGLQRLPHKQIKDKPSWNTFPGPL